MGISIIEGTCIEACLLEIAPHATSAFVFMKNLQRELVWDAYYVPLQTQ